MCTNGLLHMSRQNFRSWLYRIRPSVNNSRFKPADGIDPARFGTSADPAHSEVTPNQLRWQPCQVPAQPIDFAHGLTTICMSGRYVRDYPLSHGFCYHKLKWQGTVQGLQDIKRAILPQHVEGPNGVYLRRPACKNPARSVWNLHHPLLHTVYTPNHGSAKFA